MKWMIRKMYGAWVAISPMNFTIWAKTRRELDELFSKSGYTKSDDCNESEDIV